MATSNSNEVNAVRVDLFFQHMDSAKSTEDVDKLFDSMKSLPEAERSALIDGIESELVASLKGYTPEQKLALSQLLDIYKAVLGVSGLENQVNAHAFKEINDMQVFNYSFLKIAEIKGEKAHDVVKVFAAEATKMSDEEYNSAVGQVKLMLNVIEKVVPQKVSAPKSNPFRGNTPKM